MEPWSTEDVKNAVGEAKSRRALLVVYVRDDSEQSQAVDQLWPNIWPKFPEMNKFVALRLDKDSQSCNQFMAFFKVQTFPTIYFINGQNGQALKVVDTPLENAEQLEKIFSELLALVNPTTTVPTPAESENNSTTTQATTKSVEERVAEARARLKDLQEKREEDAKEKEKQDEMARRRLGQQMLLDKQKKDEELIRKQAEEVRRDKLEQQKLQEKLKAQIQQDREEKRRKYEQNQVTPSSQPATTTTTAAAPPSVPPVNYTRSRLQFRLTDGSFYTEDFSAEAHMSDVYSYLQETLPADQYRHGSYVLRTTHTRVTLTREETGTLKELELVPTAVLLVIPRGGNTSSPSSALTASTSIFQPISLLFAWLMIQFNFVYQLITNRVFGGGATSAGAGDRRTPTRGQQSQSTTRNSPRSSANKTQKGNFRTDATESSTIRRFHNTQDDSDDEEKRTWNGNSTQQM